MNPQLQQLGAQLSMVVDMAKGIMGNQFAVSIIARHKVGPMHLMIGDDAEPALIKTLNVLQGMGTSLVYANGDEALSSKIDQMADLLNECADRLANEGASTEAVEDNELAHRIRQVLTGDETQAGEPDDTQLTDPPGDPDE
jgi:hypothetical protein